jgi:hypothetical protein
LNPSFFFIFLICAVGLKPLFLLHLLNFTVGFKPLVLLYLLNFTVGFKHLFYFICSIWPLDSSFFSLSCAQFDRWI